MLKKLATVASLLRDQPHHLLKRLPGADGLLIRRARRRLGRTPPPPPVAGRTRQILVDISRLHQQDAGTGIQRVVRALLNEMRAAPPPGFVIRTIAGTRYRPYRYVDTAEVGGGERISVGPGDIFLGLDLSAHVIPRHHRQLIGWKRQGVSIAVIAYDILALRHPEWFSPRLAEAIRRWTRSLAILADQVICISAAVEEDFRDWLQNTYGMGSDMPATGFIPLGADISASTPSRGLPEGFDALCARIADRPSLLMVGTLEPRKGHAQVLAAFDLLWQQQQELGLIIVGRPGWKTEQLQAALRSHAELGRRLFWLDNASDEALEHLYSACHGVIVASLGEGFGLPLTEALKHGKPVLARNLPVFRPHAQPGLTFFEAGTAETLAETIRNWSGGAAAIAPETGRQTHVFDWRDSYESLKKHILPQKP